MNKNDAIGLGVVGILVGGTIAGIRWLFKKEEEERIKKEAEEKVFKEYKETYICTRDYDDKIWDATLNNNDLKQEDRAYTYDIACRKLALVELSTTIESLHSSCRKLDNFIDKLKCGQKPAEAFILYLREEDINREKKAKEAAIRKSEQEKIDLEKEKIKADKEKYKMQLNTEVEKGKTIVEAVKAVAGGKESKQDVNVTINNNEEK